MFGDDLNGDRMVKGLPFKVCVIGRLNILTPVSPYSECEMPLTAEMMRDCGRLSFLGERKVQMVEYIAQQLYVVRA